MTDLGRALAPPELPRAHGKAWGVILLTFNTRLIHTGRLTMVRNLIFVCRDYGNGLLWRRAWIDGRIGAFVD